MRQGRYLILIALLLVLAAGGITIAFALQRGPRDGHLTCYNDGGQVIFSEDVTGVWVDDRMWHFDGGGISSTRPCVFASGEER